MTEGVEVTLIGQVYGKEQASDYNILYLRNNSIIYQEQIVQEPYMLIYENSGQETYLGNTVKVSGRLSFFEKERNPGGFSQKDYYRMRKIAAYIWSEELVCMDDKKFWLRETLGNVRIRWRNLLLDYAEEEDGGILCAILLGDKGQMDTDMKELYQINGIAHILAISGLHLSFVGMGFYRLVRRITGSYPLGGITGISFLVLYILMIGCSVSVVRALIMFCIRVGADMSGRVYDAPTSVAVAAVGVVLWRPLAFYDAGFQLSFGAVCGVIFLYPVLAGKESKNHIKDSLIISFCIQLATIPFILYHYYEIPLYSILLNLIVIPFMSILLVLGFAGSLICLFWEWGGSMCLLLCRMILKLYGVLCQIVQVLPGHRVITGQPKAAGMCIYFLCLLLWTLLMCGKIHRKMQAGFAVLGGAALIFACPAVNHRGLEVTFLDVGQGDGIFLQERGGITCLIDGGSSDVSKVGRYCIEPFLKARGVSDIDYVFVTHGDSDHTNGIQELVERQDRGVKIGCMVLPEQEVWDERLEELCALAGREGVRVAVIHPGQQITGKSLTIECICPDGKEVSESGNSASLVLEAVYGQLDILFTGDVEGWGETLLTETLHKQYEVLKVAHHGSGYSTGEAFLEKASPKLAVISAGRKNRYGHPHEETLKRLKQEGAAVFRTDQSGAIILKLTGKEVANLKIIQYNRFYEKLE